jgi:hypothetical protein
MKNEGFGIGEEDLPEVQDHPARRRRAGHLHGSAAQATSRLTRGASPDRIIKIKDR